MIHWLAIDIGGANLKAADGLGYANAQYFPLWERSHQLADAIRTLIHNAPPVDHIAATMTGELADCFRTKQEGVEKILAALAAGSDRRHTRVYLTDGRLVSPQVATREPLRAAASNWHALARFAGRYARSAPALLVDIGSTTSDLVPLENGAPAATGHTDPERLLAGEMVYTGVDRSPACAIVRTLPWRSQQCPVAHELFATARDAYLVLEELPEDSADKHTADGRPATRPYAAERLGRSICADSTMFTEADAVRAAEAIRAAQLDLLEAAARRVGARLGGPIETIVLCGAGEFLGRQLAERLGGQAKVVSLGKELGPTVSRSATAHALAVLVREGA